MSGRRVVRLRAGRSREDGPGTGAVLVSLLLHAAVLVLLVAFGRDEPEPFELMSASVRITGSLPQPPAEPRPLPEMVPPEPARSEPEPPVESTPQPRPLPPNPDPVAVGPRRQPPAREPEPEPPPPPEPEPEPEPEAPRPPAEPEGRVIRGRGAEARFEGQEVPHDAWLGGIVRSVSSKWLEPRAGLPPRPARVYFVIGRDGRVSGVRLEQSSGSSLFDRSALRAVSLADPLPRLPPAYPHDTLKVHFDFIP